MCGLVSLRTTADQFLRSYIDGMTRQNNQTVLEAGRFGTAPAVADLQQLTIDAAEIEDLKQCVAGDCQMKLSAQMIERFRRDVNWQAADYQAQATQLLKTMLVEYVRDYQARGPAALIEYNDKRNGVRLADEQQALGSASGYLNDLLRDAQVLGERQRHGDLAVWLLEQRERSSSSRIGRSQAKVKRAHSCNSGTGRVDRAARCFDLDAAAGRGGLERAGSVGSESYRG